MILGFRGWGTCVQLDNLWLIPNLQTRAGPREAHPGKTTCLGMCVLLVAVSPARERHSGDSSLRLQQTQCPWKHQGATARRTCYLSQPCLNFPGCKMGVMTAMGQPCPPELSPAGHRTARPRVTRTRALQERDGSALPLANPLGQQSPALRFPGGKGKSVPSWRGSPRERLRVPPGNIPGPDLLPPPRLPTAPAPRWETPSSLAKKKSWHLCIFARSRHRKPSISLKPCFQGPIL